jgi:hypothetical protein
MQPQACAATLVAWWWSPRLRMRAAGLAVDRRAAALRRPATVGLRTADPMVVPTPPTAATTGARKGAQMADRKAGLRTVVPLVVPMEARKADRMAQTS